MNELETLPASTLATYPVNTRATPAAANSAIEEITVKAEKQDEDGFTFWDFLDVVNPLQHIPIVNTVYREMTGDEIRAPAKMIGSAILGGPVGLAVAMVDTLIEDTTGKDMGRHAMAMFTGDDPATSNGETVLANSSAATSSEFVDAAQTLTTAVAAATQVAASQATTAREFIPALSLSTTSGSSASLSGAIASFIEDGTKDPVQEEADTRTQETQASIAAASAAAPQGLVFMPLPGRQSAGFKSAASTQSGDGFMPINRSGAATRTAADPLALAQLQAQTAYPPGPLGASGSANNTFNTDQMSALMEATKPQGDTGRMPTADPFAAARMVGEQNAPTVMPAWFEAATSGALDKYKAMQAAP